ncbi:DUF6774 domain-containing protein [Butyricicoccus sp. Marseille-Q5471]|uniref:DUF6774 domain-containing protein n=1 Tax=Butyricicoccus sp. Marseille-Q5471 TaxID=3039493 RepID=UPI0024BD2B84|nr:DUF6774 domain-containing protein [Butyricicoccus sp. Marseille-Q5471]
MDANQLAAAVTALAIAISNANTVSDTALLGILFTQLGDTLTTLSTQRGASENT